MKRHSNKLMQRATFGLCRPACLGLRHVDCGCRRGVRAMWGDQRCVPLSVAVTISNELDFGYSAFAHLANERIWA